MKAVRAALAFTLLLPVAVSAQATTGEGALPARLSLEDALEIARTSNPALRQTRNDAGLADWEVREAYSRFFPMVSASAGVQWQGSGEQTFGSLTLGDLGFTNQPSYYMSNYRLGMTYSLDWATLKGPAQAKAGRRVTQAQIGAAQSNLVSQVTDAYLEVLRQDYVRTARAKGVPEGRVVWRHALRNALIPVVTAVGLSLPVLVGGAVLTETVFAWPGIGRLAVGAVFERDYPVIMGVNLLVAAVVIGANLLTDLAYGLLDPRIRFR